MGLFLPRGVVGLGPWERVAPPPALFCREVPLPRRGRLESLALQCSPGMVSRYLASRQCTTLESHRWSSLSVTLAAANLSPPFDGVAPPRRPSEKGVYGFVSILLGLCRPHVTRSGFDTTLRLMHLALQPSLQPASDARARKCQRRQVRSLVRTRKARQAACIMAWQITWLRKTGWDR